MYNTPMLVLLFEDFGGLISGRGPLMRDLMLFGQKQYSEFEKSKIKRSIIRHARYFIAPPSDLVREVLRI